MVCLYDIYGCDGVGEKYIFRWGIIGIRQMSTGRYGTPVRSEEKRVQVGLHPLTLENKYLLVIDDFSSSDDIDSIAC